MLKIVLSLEEREGQESDFSMEEKTKQVDKHREDTRPPTHLHFKVMIPGIKTNTFNYSVR